MAGCDNTLLALAGCGQAAGAAFGFASCERAVGAAEGINVLVHEEAAGAGGAPPCGPWRMCYVPVGSP